MKNLAIVGSGYFIIGDVVNTVLETSIGKIPEFDIKFNKILNQGIIKNPPITNYKKFIESGSRFMPQLKNAKYVGSSFCIKTVLPNVEKTDSRPTLVEKIDEKTISVFSGKIPTCVETAEEIKKILDSSLV